MRPPFYVGETRNFLSFTKRKHFKNYEKCFLFHRKSPFCFRDIQFFVFFPFLSTASRRKGSDETEITLTLWTGLHKLADVSFGITIVIRNGKIVWKHGPYCWYFCLNLEYLGWPNRAYIKTAKNGNFCGEFLSKNDCEAVLATFCSYDHGAKVSEAVQKIAADQKGYRKCSLCVVICWIAKIYLSINKSEKWLVTTIPPT